MGFLDRVVTHPWIVGLLFVVFCLSLLAFWVRVRRENRRGRRRLRKPGERG